MQAVAIAVVVLTFVIGAGLLLRASRGTSAPASARSTVPPALRPGDTDDVLEGERLMKVQRLGFVFVGLSVLFLPAYWLAEPGRMASKEELFEEISIERGDAYFHDEVVFVEGAEIVPVECSRCHGEGAAGGENEFLDPSTGEVRKVIVPELRTIFSKPVPPVYQGDVRQYVYETIERGRPGTDMPTWGNKFGGPLTEQQIDDIVNWLESIQVEPEEFEGVDGEAIFMEFCAACHGIGGAGGSGPAMLNGSEVAMFPNIDDHIAFVKEGSKPGQPYGTTGRGTGAMPPWEGRLTEEQIRAVVEYERSL